MFQYDDAMLSLQTHKMDLGEGVGVCCNSMATLEGFKNCDINTYKNVETHNNRNVCFSSILDVCDSLILHCKCLVIFNLKAT